MSCRPEELVCQESHPQLPFFLNALWVQSKLSASVKALRLSTQKVHLTLLMSTRFTTHAQNKSVKQPATMLQRVRQVHALYNILAMHREHQE